MAMMMIMRSAFADWLDGQLRQKGYTNAEFARQLNVVPSSVSQWVTSAQLPRSHVIGRMASVLGVDTDFILSLITESRIARVSGESTGQQLREPRAVYDPSGEPPQDPMIAFRRAVDDMIVVPLGDISAGPGVWTDQTFYLPRSMVKSKKVVGYRVRGTSMEPEIPDRAIVAVDKDRPAKPGDIVVAWTTDGGVVKRLMRRGSQLMLIGNDGSETPVNEDVAVDGVVISVTSFML